jgi:hypothetical protein
MPFLDLAKRSPIERHVRGNASNRTFGPVQLRIAVSQLITAEQSDQGRTALMSKDQAARLARARAHLMSVTGPSMAGPLGVLALFAQLEVEADDLLARAQDDTRPGPEPREIAAHLRRRAHAWTRLAQDYPTLFEGTSTAALRAWYDAELAVIRDAAGQAAP